MKQPTQLKYVKIKNKVNVTVYYEEQFYNFINDPEDQIPLIKKQIY